MPTLLELPPPSLDAGSFGTSPPNKVRKLSLFHSGKAHAHTSRRDAFGSARSMQVSHGQRRWPVALVGGGGRFSGPPFLIHSCIGNGTHSLSHDQYADAMLWFCIRMAS